MSISSQLIDFLSQPEAVKKLAAERFRPEFLTDKEDTARRLLEFQLDHLERYGVPASLETLGIEFGNIEFETPQADLEWLIDKFRKRFASNQAKEILTSTELGQLFNDDPIAAVQKVVKDLGQIRDQTRRQNILIRSDDSSHVLEHYWATLDAMGGKNGVATGYHEMNEHFGGWKPEQLIFYIARPKRYKSWQQVKGQVAAQKDGWTPLYFPLEMGKTEIFYRYACMVSGVSYTKFVKNQLTVKERVFMMDAVDKLSETAPAYFIDPPRGERSVSNMVHIAKDVGADILFIDQLKFIEPPKATDSRHYAVELICEELKDAARNFPIVVSCQFNREAENMQEMADLSKIGLSDAIGQTGDVLMGLYANKEMRGANIVQFGVLDARAHEAKTWELSVDLGINSNFRVVDEL